MSALYKCSGVDAEEDHLHRVSFGEIILLRTRLRGLLKGRRKRHFHPANYTINVWGWNDSCVNGFRGWAFKNEFRQTNNEVQHIVQLYRLKLQAPIFFPDDVCSSFKFGTFLCENGLVKMQKFRGRVKIVLWIFSTALQIQIGNRFLATLKNHNQWRLLVSLDELLFEDNHRFI